ncbi:MAG: RNA polymerase sigma factor [Paracoccaceae bacterium]
MPLPHLALPCDALLSLLPAMNRLARRLCHTPDTADDLVQEAALRILSTLANGREIDDLRPYAMATLRNLARSQGRQKRDTVEIQDDTVSVLPEAPRHLACCEMLAAIERLPKSQAALMVRVAAGEASPAELAHSVDCPVGTVMSRLARARATLRREMGLAPDAPVTELF